MNNKVDSMISLAAKAHKVQSGELACEIAVKKLEAKLLIIAEDASDNTKKKFINMSNTRNIKYIIYSNKDNLGHIIGKDLRSVICITNDNFANSIVNKLENIGGK